MGLPAATEFLIPQQTVLLLLLPRRGTTSPTPRFDNPGNSTDVIVPRSFVIQKTITYQPRVSSVAETTSQMIERILPSMIKTEAYSQPVYGLPFVLSRYPVSWHSNGNSLYRHALWGYMPHRSLDV